MMDMGTTLRTGREEETLQGFRMLEGFLLLRLRLPDEAEELAEERMTPWVLVEELKETS